MSTIAVKAADDVELPAGRRPRVLLLVENESVPHDRRVWDEGRTLARAGFEIVVVCPQGEGPEREPFERRVDMTIHRYPAKFADGGALGYLREYCWACWQTWRLTRRLSRDSPFDVVHVANPPDLLLLAAWPLKLRGASMVFDHHDLVPELFRVRFGDRHRLLRLAVGLAERLSFALADVVISTNESYRRVALARGRKRPEDVFVVRNAPDLTRLRVASPAVPYKRDKRHLIAYLGVMGPQDGIDHALEALAELAAARRDWHAIFLGDGDALPEMRRRARQLALDGLVEFAGWQDDDGIARVLSTADIAIAPDPSNALNDVSTMAKIAEYMAFGLPIVSYDLLESRATAADAAIYARPNDPREFGRRIDALLSNPQQRSAMAATGRARVEGSLGWEHSARALLAAYARALEAVTPLPPPPR